MCYILQVIEIRNSNPWIPHDLLTSSISHEIDLSFRVVIQM